MFEITWSKRRGRTLMLDLPVDGSTMAKLDRVLGLETGDWKSTEAVLILSEYLARAVGEFAALKALPPTVHQMQMAGKTIGATRVVIPPKAMRDREVMRDFLAKHAPRRDLPASFVLAGKPVVEVLPQHPVVMRRLKAAGAIRIRPSSAVRKAEATSTSSARTTALMTRVRSNLK